MKRFFLILLIPLLFFTSGCVSHVGYDGAVAKATAYAQTNSDRAIDNLVIINNSVTTELDACKKAEIAAIKQGNADDLNLIQDRAELIARAKWTALEDKRLDDEHNARIAAIRAKVKTNQEGGKANNEFAASIPGFQSYLIAKKEDAYKKVFTFGLMRTAYVASNYLVEKEKPKDDDEGPPEIEPEEELPPPVEPSAPPAVTTGS